MELRPLEYFVAVANELHFARAAANLHVAQPSVSQQIKALEIELGVQLFDRTSKAVALTSAGAELLPLATELLADAKHLQRVAQTSARRVGGQIRIGFLGDEYAQPRAERVFASIRRHHPRLVIEFSQVDFAEHHRALETGEVDVAFVFGPAPDSITTVPLFEWPRFVAVSKSLAERHPDDIGARLREEPVALPIQMSSHVWRLAWTSASQQSGPTYVVGEESMEAMLAVVGAGRAYCVVPEYVARFYPQPGVTFLTIDDVGPCGVGLGALRSRMGEPHIDAVLKIARSVTHRRRVRTTPPG
jgi:DNA-binding transcriptional LysR family regulator